MTAETPEPLRPLVSLAGSLLAGQGSPRALLGEIDRVWALFDDFHRHSLEPALSALSELDRAPLARARRELIHGAVRFQEALYRMEDSLMEPRPADLRRGLRLLLEGVGLLQTGLHQVREYLLDEPGLLAVA
ncbi:MAG: hypothetical protein AB1758_22410 [Candidatus Eremiobacterota bacterium]